MSLQRPNLTHPVAGAELAAGRVLWLPDFPQAGSWGGYTRQDVTGRGNNATIHNGPVWVPGQGYGQALLYDGTNDYSDVPSTSDLSSQNCTWAISFRTSMAVTGFPWVMGRAGSSFSESGLFIQIDQTSGQIRGSVKSGLDYVSDAKNGGPAVNDGKWHRVHLVVQDQVLTTLYLDGVPVATNGFSGTWSFGTNPVRIAISTDTFWAKFQGEMGNEAVWSRPLTAAEVRRDCDLERARRAPVRRLPRQEAFQTSGGTVNWTAPDVTLALTAWVASASGSQGGTWTAPDISLALTAWVATLTPTYSQNNTWAAPNVVLALTNWSASTSQPGTTDSASGSRPFVPRVPLNADRSLLARHTEITAAILNGLSLRGQLVQIGPTDYRLFGAAVTKPRAPTAADDATRGSFIGLQWVNTMASPRTLYVCLDATAGAAVWRSVNLT